MSTTFHQKLERYKVLSKKQDEDFMVRLYAQQADSTENKDLRTAYEAQLDQQLAELEGNKPTKKAKAKSEQEAEPEGEEATGEQEESKKK